MKSKINVKLLHATPLWVSSTAIRTCRDNHHASDSVPYSKDGEVIHHNYPECLNVTDSIFDTIELGTKDSKLIDNIANKFKHESTVEHINFNFYISNLPRNVLQELARHRIASYTVKSSRYTLNELKKVKSFFHNDSDDLYTPTEDTLLDIYMDKELASKYVYLIGDEVVDSATIRGLEALRLVVKSGVSMDKAKFCMPEAYLTELTFSINARSLKNLLNLRLHKDALFAIQELGHALLDAIPEEYRFLVTSIEDDDIEDDTNYIGEEEW